MLRPSNESTLCSSAVLEVGVAVWVIGVEWMVESNSALVAVAARGVELNEWVNGAGGAKAG